MRLIERIWFKKHPAKWLFVPLLFPLTLLFWLLTILRRASYRLGLAKSYSIDVPVVVVGNISVGGNGKTPVVVYLVEQCVNMGLKPGVISRGYGGQAEHYPYLLDQHSTPEQAGDEPILIYQRCQVPVVVGSDRVASAQLLVELGCDVIISDDGLQHYRLGRDVELIIIDGIRRFGNGLLLPAGPLREGQWRLKTTDYIIVNGGKAEQNEVSMSLKPQFVCHLLTGKQVPLAQFVAKNAVINAMAGIGAPERFFTTLSTAGFSLAQTKSYVDHSHYRQDDISAFTKDIPLLMTEKDAVKCKGFAQEHCWYLPVEAVFNDALIDSLLVDIQTLAERSKK